ncbi:transposase [Mesorhizobium sp.]|uniref:transposase n=1 Tax=Mesorhizobium sp. TaxID=1871066 RepID=UPI0033906246
MRQSPHSTKNHNLIVAVTFVTEVGDASRFESPRQLWDISVWFPASAQPGETVRRGGITKAGNGRVRHMLVAPGPIDIRPRSGRRSYTDWSRRHRRCVRSPGRRSPA